MNRLSIEAEGDSEVRFSAFNNWHLSHTQKAIGQPPGVLNALVVIVARRVETRQYRSKAIVGFDMICDSAAGSRVLARITNGTDLIELTIPGSRISVEGARADERHVSAARVGVGNRT